MRTFLTGLIVAALIVALVPPVVVDASNACREACRDERDDCEDDAYAAYRRCVDDDYIEESICNYILEIQLGVCSRNYDNCIRGCPS